jgi:hypothetical protein
MMRQEQRPVMPPLEQLQHPSLINPPAPPPGPVLPWTSPRDDDDEASGEEAPASGEATPEDPRDEDLGDGG